MIDITKLKGKEPNELALAYIEDNAIPSSQYTTNEEWNTLVSATEELQKADGKSVKEVKFNGVTYTPKNGVVEFNQSSDTTTYAIKLISDLPGDINIKSGDSLLVGIRYMAIMMTPLGDRVNYRDRTGSLSIATQKSGTDTWVEKYTQSGIVSQSEDYDPDSPSSSVYPFSLDLGKYLDEGQQQVRILVSSSYADENNIEHTFQGYLVYSINAVNLFVKNLTDWSKPILATDGGFPLSFSVMGTVDRTLHVQITGSAGTWQTDEDITASQQYNENNPWKRRQAELSSFGILSHGVHTVTAWLTCSDGRGGTLTSDTAINRFMVVNTTNISDIELAKPYLLLQAVQSVVKNYVRTTISQFAIWNPKSATVPTVASEDPLPISIRITDSAKGDTDYKQAYYISEQKVLPGRTYDIDTTIEIEGPESGTSPKSYNAYLRIFRYDEQDAIVNFLKDSIDAKYVLFTVDNENDYSPVSGADFYLDPKVRNNTESNWQSIVNKRDNTTIPSTWSGFDGNSDGWTTDSEGVKVLRIPSGRTLTIGYEPFEAFKTDPGAKMTLEIEFAMRNITDESIPVINISKLNNTLGRMGIMIKPLVGALWAKEKQNEEDQDFGFEEDKRVHVVFTFDPKLVAKSSDEFLWQTPNGTPSNRPTAKVYINSKPQRAVQYRIDTTGVWTPDEGHGGIVLGNPDCDLDIYTIRCYRSEALSAYEVRQNFVATRPTAEAKNKFREENDILDNNGRVSYDKVKAHGKRCLTLVGTDNYKQNQDKKVGYPCYWKIDYFDNNGNYVPELSGTLCQAAYEAKKADDKVKCLMNTAQGSTANTYWWNNEQTKMDKVTYRITIPFNTLHNDFGWKASLSNFTEETPAANPLTLDNEHIQGDAVSSLSESERERLMIEVIDGWIDGNGMYHGTFYTSAIGAAKATKLVNKINYASPMQSHKMGATRLYNDVMKKVAGTPACVAGKEGARFSVLEDSFFFFNNPDTSVATDATSKKEYREPIFIGFSTFGSGKCDKPTWGFDKKKMFAFEGLNNNLSLCDFRVPADEKVTYSVDDEAWCYGEDKSFELSLGATNEDGTPTSQIDSLFRRYVNFIYAHDIRIAGFEGTRAAFDAHYQSVYERATSPNATNADTSALATMQTTKYWLYDGDFDFHLLRFDYTEKVGDRTGAFVDAGTWTAEGGYKAGVRNLATDPITASAYKKWKDSTDNGDYDALNLQFQLAIASSFNTNCDKFLDKKNHQTHYNLVNFFFAGTDNCSKNTYYTIDFTTSTCWLYQDDMDTIFCTDNNGRQTKVYFLSRIFDEEDTKAGLKKQKDYEGSASALFNVMEMAWETADPTAFTGNMRNILTAMRELVAATDSLDDITDTQKQTPYGCLHKYFFSIQKYFPSAAWAEQQRIRYDWPASWGYSSSGNQARSILAVTQGIGDQLEREVGYMTRRLALVCSYAAWGDFAATSTEGVSGLTDATDSFNVSPGKLSEAEGGGDRKGGEYTFDLVAHQYIYAVGTRDRVIVNPHVRLIPGKHYSLTVATATNSVSGDSAIALAAINYYRSIGNVGNMVVGNNELKINGKRLKEFVAEPANNSDVFAPKQITLEASNLQRFSLRGFAKGQGSLSLSKATRLHTLDLSDTHYGEVTLPQSPQLTSAKFGPNLSKLDISDMPQLTTLTIDGCASLTEFSLRNCPVDARSIVRSCAEENAPLRLLRLEGVDWADISSSVLSYLAGIATASLTGRLAVTQGQNIDAALKRSLILKFGNVDSESNPLYISYQLRNVTKIAISTQKFILSEPGDYAYQADITPPTANNFSKVEWSLSVNDVNATVDPSTGIVHAPRIGKEEDSPTAELTVKITLIDGKVIEDHVSLKLYNRLPKLGDWAYHDGEFDSDFYAGKTVIGWVYKVTKYKDLVPEVRNYYLRDESIKEKYDKDNGESLYEVLIEATDALSATTSDGKTNYTGFQWGIYPDESANNGFTTAERTVIADVTGLPVDNVTDLANLPNIGTTGLPNEQGTSNSYQYIRDFNAYDDDTDDGFPVYEGNNLYNKWDGKAATDTIIAQATQVLQSYVADGVLLDKDKNDIWDYINSDHVIPESLTELVDLCDILKTMGGADRWMQLCYPAAFAAHVYEPKAKGSVIEGLSPAYQKGNWYLPAMGDIMRLFTFFRNSRGLTPQDSGNVSADYSDEDNLDRELAQTDARKPCYANLLKRAKDKGQTCPVAMPVQASFWSSTECYSSSSWYMAMGTGTVGLNYKFFGLRVRPSVAFVFSL